MRASTTMGRPGVTVGITLVVAGLCLLAGGSARAQTAATVESVGWWTDRSLAQPRGPGGFEVASTLDGTSVAAIALRVDGEPASATLTLAESGGLRPETAVLRVCATAAFEPADGGALADAPATTCQTGVDLSRGDGGTWTGAVASLLDGPVTALAVVPATPTAEPSPVDPGFTVEFSGVTVTATGPVSPTEPPTTTTPRGTTQTLPPATAPPPETGGFTPSAPEPQFVPPPAPATTIAPGTPTTIAPPVDASTAEDREIAGAPLAAGPITGGSGDAKPWVRLLLLMPLSVAAGAGAIFGRRTFNGSGADA